MFFFWEYCLNFVILLLKIFNFVSFLYYILMYRLFYKIRNKNYLFIKIIYIDYFLILFYLFVFCSRRMNYFFLYFDWYLLCVVLIYMLILDFK